MVKANKIVVDSVWGPPDRDVNTLTFSECLKAMIVREIENELHHDSGFKADIDKEMDWIANRMKQLRKNKLFNKNEKNRDRF